MKKNLHKILFCCVCCIQFDSQYSTTQKYINLYKKVYKLPKKRCLYKNKKINLNLS